MAPVASMTDALRPLNRNLGPSGSGPAAVDRPPVSLEREGKRSKFKGSLPNAALDRRESPVEIPVLPGGTSAIPTASKPSRPAAAGAAQAACVRTSSDLPDKFRSIAVFDVAEIPWVDESFGRSVSLDIRSARLFGPCEFFLALRPISGKRDTGRQDYRRRLFRDYPSI